MCLIKEENSFKKQLCGKASWGEQPGHLMGFFPIVRKMCTARSKQTRSVSQLVRASIPCSGHFCATSGSASKQNCAKQAISTCDTSCLILSLIPSERQKVIFFLQIKLFQNLFQIDKNRSSIFVVCKHNNKSVYKMLFPTLK
jgi:hypothetical protein